MQPEETRPVFAYVKANPELPRSFQHRALPQAEIAGLTTDIELMLDVNATNIISPCLLVDTFQRIEFRH